MSPIGNDGANEGALDETGAMEAFLRGFGDDAVKPSSAGEEEKKKEREERSDEQEDEADEHEGDDEGSEETPGSEDDDEGSEDGDEGDEKAERKFAEDDGIYVKVKVGDEEHEVPVKDLKRLFGQEAALTKRSQEVATRRQQIDDESALVLARNQAMLARAQENWKQYENLDFLALSRNPDISTEELTALRAAAQRAYEDVQFLTSEGQQFMTAIQKRQHADLQERASATIKVLADPEKGLPGWSEKLYDDIRAHALSLGAPADVVNSAVDEWSIRLMHDAMMYQRGKSKIVTTKVKKDNKAPKRVLKTSTNPSATKQAQPTKAKKALQRLQITGSVDDAADAFMHTLHQADD
jgi:hypothetical protein